MLFKLLLNGMDRFLKLRATEGLRPCKAVWDRPWSLRPGSLRYKNRIYTEPLARSALENIMDTTIY